MKLCNPRIIGVFSLIALLVVVAIAIFTKNYGKSNELAKANAQEILQILSENPDGILEKLELKNIEISLPLDGKGGRVLVRVEPGEGVNIPESVTVNHGNKELEVPLEVTETYEQFSTQ